jgi:hypothetical protein
MKCGRRGLFYNPPEYDRCKAGPYILYASGSSCTKCRRGLIYGGNFENSPAQDRRSSRFNAAEPIALLNVNSGIARKKQCKPGEEHEEQSNEQHQNKQNHYGTQSNNNGWIIFFHHRGFIIFILNLFFHLFVEARYHL